jgi:phosphoribosylaminoimidazole-succinocarboxamide synthase
MQEREALARDNALPEEVIMDISSTYINIAEKITGSKIVLSDNPKQEVIDVLAERFQLIK